MTNKRSLVLPRRLPVSTNERSPGASPIELRAFDICPFPHERYLKKTLSVYVFYLYDLLAPILYNDSTDSFKYKDIATIIVHRSIHLSILLMPLGWLSCYT